MPQFIIGQRLVSAVCVISITPVLTSQMVPEVPVNRTKSCVHASAMCAKAYPRGDR